MRTDVSIVGAGGHALVVMDALELVGQRFDLWDQNQQSAGRERMGCVVRHLCDTDFAGLSQYVHIAIGHNLTRERLAGQLIAAGKTLISVVHPMASVAASSKIEPGAFVAANASVAPMARIGTAAIINHSAVVDHDATVGACAHVAPNATVSGRAQVGRCALIGASSVILTACQIDDEVVIAPGTVVSGESKQVLA